MPSSLHRRVLLALLCGVVPASAAEKPRPLPFFPAVEEWTRPLSAAPIVGLVADAERVYVLGRNGTLHAVTIASGAIAWQVPIGSGTVRPALEAGLIVAAGPGSRLRAFRAESGALVWDEDLRAEVSGPLRADAGWVYAAAANGDLAALRAADGKEIWRYRAGAAVTAAIGVAGDRVFLGCADGTVRALDAADGHLVWQTALGRTVRMAPTPFEDHLFVGADDNFFYCLATRNGERQWRWRTGADLIGQPLVHENVVYVAGLDDQLWALKAGSGDLKWRAAVGGRPFEGPIAFEQSILVAHIGSDISEFRAHDGASSTRFTAPSEITAAPVLAGPRLFLVTDDGVLRSELRASLPARRFPPRGTPLFGLLPDPDWLPGRRLSSPSGPLFPLPDVIQSP